MITIKNNLSPMMETKDMIYHLKNKNIKFERINEKSAFLYLKFHSNYYNITSYKNNFIKYPNPAGKMEGKYLDLDFAYLIDLSIIDMKLRLILFDEKRLHKNILKKLSSDYSKKIFSKYDADNDNRLENIPIWEFLEMITMGTLIDFYEFFIKEYKLEKEYQSIYILKEIVKLRNAVAHNNNNILNNLEINDNPYKPHIKIIDYLDNCNISIKMRNKKLSNSRIR